jgi:ferrous iron transport protein A
LQFSQSLSFLFDYRNEEFLKPGAACYGDRSWKIEPDDRNSHNFMRQKIKFQQFLPQSKSTIKKHKMKRLSELEPGTVARIHSFEKNELFLKLMEMGCVPGELVRVEQIAPLGDPISITVAGYSLSLRLDEAENIFLEEGDK